MKQLVGKINEIKEEIIAAAIGAANYTQSSQSESRYFQTKYGKVRVSGHSYPTGDMTNLTLNVFDTYHHNGVYQLALAMGQEEIAKKYNDAVDALDKQRDEDRQRQIKQRYQDARDMLSTGVQNENVKVENTTVFYKSKEDLAEFRKSCAYFDYTLPVKYAKM